MDSESKQVFPLSRQFYEDSFKFYYPFGNSPPEDLLQSVSLADCRQPTVLSLGCGDMRSPMFTILSNFGLQGEISDAGFSGIHFVLNDRSASVLARNILFLYLCMLLPGSGVERKRWIASMWSIWYNHELQPQHNDMLLSALEELCCWSVSWQEWSKCPLGKLVKFSSPATFAAVKKVWCKWQSFSKSVEDMKQGRNHFQSHHMKVRGFSKNREDGLKKFAERDVLLSGVHYLYSPKKIGTIEKEFLDYLLDGFVWAETVLGVPTASPKTVVNPTLFEHAEGMYTLHYGLTPYMGFILSFQYTQAELRKVLGQKCPLLKTLPVSDGCFHSKPLLANCVQQFTMWLQATVNVITKSSDRFSFTFDLDDSLSFCFSLFNFPDKYTESIFQFDAIYTSNLFDHLSPPALVLNALNLLKSTGTLFTETFSGPQDDYLENNFGLSPEHFPPLLGVHCIGQDGPYSPAVSHDPHPNVLHSLTHSKRYIWKKINVTSNPLLFDSIDDSKLVKDFLLKLCNLTALLPGPKVIASFESFLCILHQFLKQVQFTTPIHQFLQPLCDAIRSEVHLMPHLIQLQTQSLLHDIHMHLTLTDNNCPICRGQPLDSYIQQFRFSLDSNNLKMQPFEPPTFDLQFASLFSDNAVVKSFSISCSESKLDLTFFLPKHYLSRHHLLRVEMLQNSKNETVYCGPVGNLKQTSTFDYVFMKKQSRSDIDSHVCPLGHITKHIGDGHKYETVISMSDACVTILKESRLSANCLKQNQLQLCCGQLKFTISYPYAIEESKTHIKISKMKKVISVVVQHKASPLLNEKLTYFIDARNRVTHPNFHCGADVMEKYCSLQSQYNIPDHPLCNGTQSFTEFFKNALNGQKIFTLSFPSKRFADSPDVHALVFVHNLCFSTVFSSPVLDVSYCFLDTKPQHLLCDFQRLTNSFGHSCAVMVDDTEYKFLKVVFKYFSSIVRHPFPSDMSAIAKAIEKHKLWEHFDHAILFPLYPNPANSAYQKFIKFINHATGGMWQPGNMSTENILSIGQGRRDACSFCQTSAVALKCEQCQRASYCSSECQQLHWKFHSLICNKANLSEPTVSSFEQTTEKTANAARTNDAGSSQKKTPPSTAVLESHEAREEVKSPPPRGTSLCARCNQHGTILCQCQQVSYCSKECQTVEWPGHNKKSCMSSAKSPPSHLSTKTEIPSGKTKSHSTQQPSGIECVRCKKVATIVCQCKQVSYCSEICQNLEWPVHSETCVRTSQDPPQSQSYSTPERSKKATESKNPKTVSIAQKCYSCGKTKSSLKHCKCRNVMYCSVECQRLHWPQHKPTCTVIRK